MIVTLEILGLPLGGSQRSWWGPAPSSTETGVGPLDEPSTNSVHQGVDATRRCPDPLKTCGVGALPFTTGRVSTLTTGGSSRSPLATGGGNGVATTESGGEACASVRCDPKLKNSI